MGDIKTRSTILKDTDKEVDILSQLLWSVPTRPRIHPDIFRTSTHGPCVYALDPYIIYERITNG